MKRISVLALAASVYLQPVALADSPTRSRIQIRNGGQTVAAIGHVNGQLQVRADRSSGTAESAVTFTGNVAVTEMRNGKTSFHLRADEAVIESDNLEVQVYDYRYDEQMGWVNHLRDTTGEPQAPREAFLKALQAHPQVNSFRRRFSLLLGGDGSDSTVLYHRQEQTLKYYERGSDDDGRGSYTTYYLYTGVTDKIFEALVSKYKRTEAGYTHGHFAFLTEFGCKRIELSKGR